MSKESAQELIRYVYLIRPTAKLCENMGTYCMLVEEFVERDYDTMKATIKDLCMHNDNDFSINISSILKRYDKIKGNKYWQKRTTEWTCEKDLDFMAWH